MRTVTGMVIGGTRSGKSEIAEGIFTDLVGGVASSAVYIATGPPPTADDGWAERIAIHRERRPSSWSTVEVGSLGELSSLLVTQELPVIVDSLTILAARLDTLEAIDDFNPAGNPITLGTSHAERLTSNVDSLSHGGQETAGSAGEWPDALRKLERSLATRKQAELVTMFVADEVGLSVHPPTRVGIEFQDRAGILNSTVAALCDNVWFVVAGRAMEMDRAGKFR